MAHHDEPMDIDCMESDFDNKENSYIQSNVHPCTEKGYEELDVSELNMKLRYSLTPAASPMSKSYSAYVDNRNLDFDETLNCTNENANLTRSLNSTMTKNDSVIKSLKTLPLQTISTEQIPDNRVSILRQSGDNNVTVTISEANDINENMSLPSSSSSVAHTPEATTPTNLKNEEGSPIIRGLKSVFNMFRSSQSPVPPVETETLVKEDGRPLDETYYEDPKPQALASTPISAHRSRDGSSKRSSPLKDSIVFNDDLEKELQWKDDTILFSEEKIPIHKLFLPLNKPVPAGTAIPENDNLNLTVEYMDISNNASMMLDNTVTEKHITNPVESDCEFEDCETTFNKNESQSIITKVFNDPLNFIDVTKESLNKNEDVINESNKIIENELPNVQALEKSKEVVLENDQTVCESIESKEENYIPSSSSETLDNTRDTAHIDGGNESKNETLENKKSETDIVSVINENIDIEIKNEPSIDASNTCDLTMELQQANAPEISQCHLSELENSVVESTFTKDDTLSLPKPVEDAAILLNPKLNEVQSPSDVEDKTLYENPKLSNEDSQFTFEVDTKDITLKDDVNTTELVENVKTSENDNEIQHNNTDSETVPVLEEVKNIECTQDPINDLSIDSTDQSTCLLKSTSDNTVSQITLTPAPENGLQIVQESKTLSDSSNDCKEESSHLFSEEPANIPLPDLDDFDIDLETKTDKVVILPEAEAPTMIDAVKEESNLNLSENFIEAIDDPNITDNLHAKLDELSEIEKHDTLNETNDIVNSLTEIIGESPNNTIIQSENNENQSQYDQMEGIECADQIHALPDIVNETIHNMSVDINEPELINQTQPFSESLPEKVSDVVPHENKTILIPMDASAEQSNESINANKEEIDNIILANEIIGVVPETNQDEYKCNESENALKDKEVSDENVIKSNAEVKESPNFDEELVVSENNSPYVSVIAETESKPTEESFENIDIPLDTTHPAPSSPPIRSKGYNFNFDEMDDPFATKTKVRQTPPPMSNLITPDIEDKINTGASKKVVSNRRRSQPPERKRSAFNKKKLNTTFDTGSATSSPNNTSNDVNSEGDLKHDSVDVPKNTTISIDNNEEDKEVAMILDSTQVFDKMVEQNDDISSDISIVQSDGQIVSATNTTIEISAENKSSVESMVTVTSETKTSSSENSTYYSAAASSSDNSISKNVFNLPEIDDKNFNPFASKSKIRQSPPLETKYENPFATKSKMRSSPDLSTTAVSNIESAQLFTQNLTKNTEDKMDTELMEKDSSYNISNITSSSKATDDKNITVREVNTEDEDTEEGPFLEAEDAIDRLLGMDNDMMQFNEIPAQVTDENADGGELFIDAEAFEFLLNKNQSNVVTDSGKESLFLKFDPLFAKRISSGGVLSALNNVQKRQSTPTKSVRPSLKNEASPIAGPSTLSATYDEEANVTEDSIEDLNVTVAKPMMVVTPAVNPAVTPRNKTTTPPRSNRRSITFTSPAMAVIDRLLSLSGNNSFLGQDTPVTQTSREHIEADLALTQLRELLAEKEISVYQLRSESKELKDRLTTMESQVKILEADGQQRLNKINELTDRLAEKTKVNKSMAAVVEEYERTIASLIAETEQDKKRHAEERIRLINERDEQTAHLTSMEVSFSDLHSKYEKSKQVILSCKANEETCKKSIKNFEENLTKMQTNYEMLKQHATSKLNHANQELQKITKAHESEVLKLNAMIKRKDMHITSLEETLAQKTKANEELTAICDELINKVG